MLLEVVGDAIEHGRIGDVGCHQADVVDELCAKVGDVLCGETSRLQLGDLLRGKPGGADALVHRGELRELGRRQHRERQLGVVRRHVGPRAERRDRVLHGVGGAGAHCVERLELGDLCLGIAGEFSSLEPFDRVQCGLQVTPLLTDAIDARLQLRQGSTFRRWGTREPPPRQSWDRVGPLRCRGT